MPVVAIQLSVPGLYFPPVFKLLKPSVPPQTIISVPVHTAVCPFLGDGASVTVVGTQLSVARLYLPPVFNSEEGKL
jgi:hypothetical protein